MSNSECNAPETVNMNTHNDSYMREIDTRKIVTAAQPNLNLPENCDKFRILIIGKAGVGKSTICSAVFGVPPEWVCQTTVLIIPPYFVLICTQ
jgi:predicted GTPase